MMAWALKARDRKISELCNGLRNKYYAGVTRIFYRPQFGRLGKGSVLRRPILLTGAKFISVGDRTMVRDHARIEVINKAGEARPMLMIGSDVLIEQSVHIVCSQGIRIGDHVAIAARCAIVDTAHPLPGMVVDNVGRHIVFSDSNDVSIGDRTMLGIGVVVLPGVHIGVGCMVGANSVVTQNLPDYAVAAGAPAHVVRLAPPI